MTGHAHKKIDMIYSQLRQEILTGQWPVDCKLPKESEIAKRFECSIGTVSKAVAPLVHEGLVERRARAGTRVLRNTVEPPAAAASNMDAFALIYPSERHEGIWRVVRGFNDAAQEQARRVVMLSAGADYKEEPDLIGRLSEFDVRGAVVYPILLSQQDQIHFCQMLAASKFPIVLVDVNLPGMGCPAVVADGFHAGYTMTRHLLDKGLKRIGFFSNYSWTPFMRDRYSGYRWALDEAKISHHAEWGMLESGMHLNLEDPLRESTELARVFLKTCGKLDGVVCANDFLALGLINAAHEQGLRVPEDLKVTGIDDYATLPDIVSLTTYRIPYEEMGRRAFKTLSEVLDRQSSSVLEIQLRGELVVRQSA